MKTLTLTSNCEKSLSDQILCPILEGLNATQADCAAIIPSGNANNLLVNKLPSHSGLLTYQAAILCCDPFMNRETFFTELYSRGVRSVSNWPTTIFLEHNFKKAMNNINANPMTEFECLADAMKMGMEAKAFILSLEQGKQAISQGIRDLIVHPGLQIALSEGAQNTLYESLHFMIETLLKIEPTLNVYIYQHTKHEMEAHHKRYRKNPPSISGYVIYQGSE